MEDFNGDLFDAIEPLHMQNIQKKKFTPGSDIGEFRKMQRRLDEADRLRLTVCKDDGEVVSGSVCSGLGDIAIGLISTINDRGRKSCAYYLLQWDEILWAKQNGNRYMDLGGINAEANPSVYRFKSRIGGKEVEMLGVYDFSRNPLVYLAATVLERLVGLTGKPAGKA